MGCLQACLRIRVCELESSPVPIRGIPVRSWLSANPMNGCVHQEECANQIVEDRAFGAVARVVLREGRTTMVAGIPASDRLAQRDQDRVQCPSPHSRRAHLRDAAGCVARTRNVQRVLRFAWWADCQVCVCWGVRARACVFKMYINKALCVCVCVI